LKVNLCSYIRKSSFSRLAIQWLGTILILFLTSSSFAALQTVEFRSDSVLNRVDWWTDSVTEGAQGRLKGRDRSLFLMKRAALKKEFTQCLNLGAQLRSQVTDITPWIVNQEIQCGVQSMILKKTTVERLNSLLSFLEKREKWMMIGPYAPQLRKSWVSAQFEVLNWYLKNRPSGAYEVLDEVFARLEWLTSDEKAFLFKKAGELAFIRQNVLAATSYFSRSLALKNDLEVVERLNALQGKILGNGNDSKEDKDPKVTKAPKVKVNDDLEATEGEILLSSRITVALEQGDLVTAVEDAIELLEDYPRGVRALWASDRVIDILLRLLEKKEKNFEVIKGKVTGLLLKAGPDHLFRWSELIYRKGFFPESYRFAKEALGKFGSLEPATKDLANLARAAYANGDMGAANKYYKRIFEKHSGTPESREALFRQGMIASRDRDHSAAAGIFERLLVLPETEDLELVARYWLYRSLQKIDQQRASEEAKIIIQKFGLSYYGLRLNAEINNGVVDKLGPEVASKGVLKVKMDMTGPEQSSFQRVLSLIRAGWGEEAQQELSFLPAPAIPDMMVILSRYWASAGNDLEAIKLLNSAWTENPGFIREPFLSVSFPRPFAKILTKHVPADMDKNLVLSLIRQESAFFDRAVSSSGALGLMQIIPPTADEIAGELGVKNLKLPEELFDPNRNIQFGVHYIGKMLKQFEQHVPLALAAYNAGPHRLKSWLDARKLSPKMSIKPHDEIWIEEMPWGETRFYVKAILRNLLLYRYLDAGRVEISDVFWKVAGSSKTVD
jgi:soluble lytic murein transglycosylase